MIKKRIFEIIEKAKDSDKLSKAFDYTILVLIILTVVAVILESYENLSRQYTYEFEVFEIISVTIFTIEYLLRVWTADIKYPNYSKFMSRVRFGFSFMALIDLFAILPFYLPVLLPFDLRFLRVVRLTRLFRIFKLNRYSRALNLISKVMKDKKEELFATVFIMFFIILISSTLIYYIEYEVQPEAFPNVIASFWWSIATLTTVGYGDVYPITGLGKILASVIAISGIGLVALPTGIISSGFMEEIKKKSTHKCPNCGKVFDD